MQLSTDPAHASGQARRFFEWLPGQLATPGWVTESARIESDGTVVFQVAAAEGKGEIKWHVPGTAEAGGLELDGLRGLFTASRHGGDILAEFGARLCEIVERDDPELLRFGPPSGERVGFLPEEIWPLLGDGFADRSLTWASHRIADLGHPDPQRLIVEWQTTAEGIDSQVVVGIAVRDARGRDGDESMELYFRPRDVDVALDEDASSDEFDADLAAELVTLVAFRVARALGADREMWVPAFTAEEREQLERRDDDRKQSRLRHEAFSRRWAAEYRWHRFLYPPNRCITQLFRLGSDEAFVAHESLECVLNEPPWAPPDSTMFANRRNTLVGQFWQDCRMLVTDLQGPDVVGGNSMRRLNDALGAAAELSPERAVVVKTGCLPNVIGDNPLPAMKRLGKTTDTRFYWMSSTNDYWRYTSGLIGDRLREVAPADAPRDPLGVALVSGASPPENDELLALVGRIGLHPLGVILPDVDYRAFERAAKASVFAWANQSGLRNIGEVVFEDLPVALLRPPAPIGLEATFAWLAEIAGQFSSVAEVGAALAELQADEAMGKRAEAIRTQAAAYELAFVVDDSEIELICDTTPMYSFSIVEAVSSMGFGVRFVTRAGGEVAARVEEKIRADGLGDRVRFTSFADPVELVARLAAPEVGAVFSDFSADPRAIAAGRGTFSEVDFELGIEGFFRTAETILRRCRFRPLVGYEQFDGRVS